MAGLTVAMVAIGIGTDLFVYNALVPVLPFLLLTQFHDRVEAAQQWHGYLLTTYGITYFVCAGLYGVWISHDHRQAPLLSGVVLTVCACIVLYVNQSIPALIVARALQGISSAATWVTRLVILNEAVPRERLGPTMSWIMAAYSLSGIISPPAVGAVYQRAGFRVALSLVAMVTALDLGCCVWWTVHSYLATLARPRPTPATNACPSSSAENISELFWSARLWAASVTTLAVIVVLTAIDTSLALRVETTWGWGAKEAGLLLSLLQLPGLVGAHFMGWLVGRIGPTRSTCVGMIAMIPACILLSQDFADVLVGKCLLIAGMTVIGFGASLAITALMTEFGHIYRDDLVPDQTLSRSYSIFTANLALGITVGPVITQAVINRLSWTVLFIGLASLIILITIVSLYHIFGRPICTNWRSSFLTRILAASPGVTPQETHPGVV